MSIKKSDILLIIPNYNQELEIGKFLEDLKTYWETSQTLIVDDGSTDQSARISESLGYEVKYHKVNRGLGAAIRTGIYEARSRRYAAVLIMTANGKMLPSEVDRLVCPLVNGSDYVMGSRYHPGGLSKGLGLFRTICKPLLSLVYYPSMGRFFSDISCSLRCYKIDFLFDGDICLDQSWLDRYEMEYFIQYIACYKKLKMDTVPITIKYCHLASHRRSKIRPFVDWWSIFRPALMSGVMSRRRKQSNHRAYS